MLIAGVPYSTQELMNLSEITGGSPYGAFTIAGPKGERQVTANELAIARGAGPPCHQGSGEAGGEVGRKRRCRMMNDE